MWGGAAGQLLWFSRILSAHTPCCAFLVYDDARELQSSIFVARSAGCCLVILLHPWVLGYAAGTAVK